MKKLYSLIRACMTSDMNLFKIKQKKDNKKSNMMIPFFLSLILMSTMWSYANMFFEKLAPLHLQNIVISLGVFAVSIMTFIEGIYKTSSLLFNCRDDQLLLSLPIKKSEILFVRIFKFYVFELMFNSLFLVPILIAYLRWAESLNGTFLLISIVMLLLLPVIPIVLSCMIGAITSNISSHLKFKNLTQIITSTAMILAIFYVSYNIDGLLNNIAKHATSINDMIMKLYYPAGVFAKLLTEFHIKDLGIFILINILFVVVLIFLLSKFYFKMNSRLKVVSTSKKIKINQLKMNKKNPIQSFIKKELTTFFKTPVFVVNAGFGLILFMAGAISFSIRYDKLLSYLASPNSLDIPIEKIQGNLSVIILLLILATSLMTSITNSVISLEGRNINILKSLPIKPKTILLSKVYSCLVLTTPVYLLGDIFLFIRFKIQPLEAIMLLLLSILLPLISHFIGLIINLKYPKLDAENSAEVVKQSTSSFLSVMIGMLLAVLSVTIICNILGKVNSILILMAVLLLSTLIDLILYMYIIHQGVKDFNRLTI